nr:hypothetical protein BaRGS_018748 [Batillaria attramentaria]KAG5687767.1 hypothetical protein BaRGS_014856 [Batillaria attramentaria]
MILISDDQSQTWLEDVGSFQMTLTLEMHHAPVEGLLKVLTDVDLRGLEKGDLIPTEDLKALVEGDSMALEALMILKDSVIQLKEGMRIAENMKTFR